MEHISNASTTGGLPLDASLAPALESVRAPVRAPLVNGRVVYIAGLSIGIAIIASVIARVLTALIGLVTNLAFYGSFRSRSHLRRTTFSGGKW